ncbi:hypothetical protein IJC60_00960 [bacterium]|nr:hypothetical protein [bacterium]
MNVKSLSMYQVKNFSPYMTKPSFKGEAIDKFDEYTQSFMTPKGIKVGNLFALEKDINISEADIDPSDKKTKKLYEGGIHITVNKYEDSKQIEITNDKGEEILYAQVKNGANAPVMEYTKGKYNHNVVISDKSLRGKKAMFLQGSTIETRDGEFTLRINDPKKKIAAGNLAFKGNLYISTLNKEAKTKGAVEKYYDKKFYLDAPEGDYKEIVQQHNPSLLIPAGGFGERFENVSSILGDGTENKPSSYLPRNENYRIMGTTLNMAAQAGIIEEDDEIKYLSQKHELAESDEVSHVEAYGTDGGAFAEALKKDIIPDNKDAIILNADIFTNADITRAYKALKTLPNAAAVIPYYPVGEARAKSFGLIGVEADADNNMVIKEFVEKPKYINDLPEDATAEEKEAREKVRLAEIGDKYMANPGMYFLSKEAVAVLKNHNFKKLGDVGLGADLMPTIVRLAQEGKLVDENGNQMKVYTVPLEAKGGKAAVWDDIGSAEAYADIIHDVARETRKNFDTPEFNKYYGVPDAILNDIAASSHIQTGVITMTPESERAVEGFKQKYNIVNMEGNIIVS